MTDLIQTRVPDFIIGGAPRSGTTYLCQALDRHPDIYMAKPIVPEPKVFLGPRKTAAEYYARYETLFRDAPAGKILGEKTTNYFESESACQLMAAHLPKVKLLFIVREPVSRAYSNYLWSTKNGLEKLSFEEAIRLEGQRESPLPPEKASARPFDYQSRGDYVRHAERYYKAFGRDRVAFFLYEEIEANPEKLLRSVQEYVGVNPLPAERLDVGVVNAAKDVGPPINPETEAKLRAQMRESTLRFAELTGLNINIWGY